MALDPNEHGETDDECQSEASKVTAEDMHLCEDLGAESDDSLFVDPGTATVAEVGPPAPPASRGNMPGSSNDVVVGPAPPASPPPAAASASSSQFPDLASQHPELAMSLGNIGCAAAVVHLPGAKISLYPGRRDIEVTCKNKAHGRCVLTKRCTASAKQASGQGRPLGLAMAWAAKAFVFATKEEHRSSSNWPTKQERVVGRQRLKKMAVESPDARRMLAFERPKRANEDSEPDDV